MNLNTPALMYLGIAVTILSILANTYALWRASKQSQRNWFVALGLVLAFPLKDLSLILAVTYLFFFSKKKLTFKEMESWFKKKNKK